MQKVNASTTGQATFSDEDLDLLASLLAEEGVELEQPGIGRRVPGAPVPLSFSQQRLWFLDQLQPGNPVYNLPTAVRVRGRLDLAALEQTFSEIVRRHEILRTTFSTIDGTPAQIIATAAPVSFPLIDLSHFSDEEREIEARQRTREEIFRPFDLSEGPLWRALLLRLSEDEHIVVVTMHHIISDGWSSSILVQEIAALYEAFVQGHPVPLAELPLQYGDYASWEHERLQSAEMQSQLDYWRRQLDQLPVLSLPLDRARPAVQTFNGAKHRLLVPSITTDALKALAQSEQATLFMVLLAGFSVLLSRYSSQTDIAIGTPIANRRRTELESLIGFFTNTLVLRLDTAEAGSFRELVQRAREVCLGAYANQDVPFAKLVEDLQPERSLSHTPLFQTVLVLQNVPRKVLSLPELQLEGVAAEASLAKFDLTLVVEETDSGLACTLEYNKDLFDAATTQRLLTHWGTLLEAAANNPERSPIALPLLADAERRELLAQWGGSGVDFRRHETLHQLFEAQVTRTPNAVAITFDQQHLTYAALNARANRLARYLRAQSVGPETLVALCVDRSFEMVVAILAILKTGAAYVPLEPANPKERLAFMLDDSRAPVLITQSHLRDRLPEFNGVVVTLDDVHQLLANESYDNQTVSDDNLNDDNGSAGNVSNDNIIADNRSADYVSDENLSVAVMPANTAYVIYTSGSTGRAKGTYITHSNVTRLFAATDHWFNFGSEDVWTLFHSYAFDFSVWEIWGALLYGGRLVIVPYWISRTPDAFYQLLSSERVTVLNQTPTAFRQLIHAEEQVIAEEQVSSNLALRLVIFGGEALEPASLKPWVERHGDELPQVINMYGITETTVHVTYRRLRRSEIESAAGSVIGIPIPDLQVYVLDQMLEPVPPGITGEMYVGGEGLARGYLARPELTAERFIPHPFSTTPGARLYRTGDLARYAGNELQYLGRCDQQVKIRGFRIELGEIQAVLIEHPSVREAIVLDLPDSNNERRLVAYVTLKETVAPDQLRAFIKLRLLEHMIPAAFVILDEVPLTPNGKLDRRALPAPESTRSGSDDSYVPPRTASEEILASIWADVLELDRVGINDNFFALGGDSILSVRVLAKARERGIDFSLQQLFQSQTIAELAAQLNRSEIQDAPDGGPFSLTTAADRAKLPGDIDDAYPLAMLQAGMLYHIAYSPGEMIYHNVYSYHLRARLDVAALRDAVQKVVARHPILRTSFDLTTYSEPLQLVHTTASLPLEVDDLRQTTAEEQERILDEFMQTEKRRPFDYSKPPLLRLHLHRRTDDEFNFTLTEFHPILDGWSLHSLLAEIFTSYFSSLDDKPVPAPKPLSSTYREFVQRERLALESEECKRYWDGKLRDIRPTELPRWPTHATQASARIIKLSHPLAHATSQGLKQVARSLGVPLKSVLLAAHLKVLSVLCGQDDIVTGLVSNGRPEETDGDKTIGLFFNTLPFHARLSRGNGSWRELIQATFKAELELLPYRRYPVAALQKQWGRKPLFDSVFNYLHFHVLNELARSNELELIGPSRYWEETNLALSTAFVLPPLSDSVILTLRFDTTQFGTDQIESIGGYYTRVLERIVKNVDEQHGQQSLLAADEQQRILFEWSSSPSPWLREPSTIHHAFAEQVEKTPEATAVVYEGESLTYRQLDERASRLARELRKRGAGPEVPVVIFLERSVETVVAILGVLKAGGAYVPVEIDQPRQRIALMLAELDHTLVLTQQKLVPRLPPDGVNVICFEANPEQVAETGNAIEYRVEPDNLAYLMFTSGSSGKPKMVAVEHLQLFSYVRGVSQRLALSGPLNYALASTFATDLGHTVIFPALLTGGTLHVLPTRTLTNPDALGEYFERHGIDCLKIVPTHLAALLASRPARRILPRHRLILGGDVCNRELVDHVHTLAPDCSIFNHYGPTETTVGVLAHHIDFERQQNVPLGRPLPGAEVYVLDSDLNPVPTGTPGELYIGGKGVTRGYFNQPATTASHFVPHPFSREAGARLYRSGDLARYSPVGNVEFLGRMDHQVKIRGYRVEPGEIEALLSQHPAVAGAVVAVTRDEQQNKQLIAYIVANSSAATSTKLRTFLRQKLPDYAVPSLFVMLDKELPLTPSGKIDRNALPQASGVALQSDAAHVAPRNELEQTIAAIWSDSLKVERVSVHDNFFDVGGHSLVVLQVQSKLRDALKREIPIVTMFEHPTISSLAKHLNDVAPDAEAFAKANEEAAARRASLERRQLAKVATHY